ncbi:hypothetical protein [Rhizobium sp. BK008]|uniref:hypothetical protein n=1 Tax=Rhizobium sp. BK008 TaxID=2587094 RepID=UPI0016178D58|nr:hypothetical protein [Rhizobium sp. BK008]MBB4255669.1 hypothetical protein [Rhizobium sp. BK008]
MNEGSSAINTSMIEEKIIESILAAQIRLLFDKSVLRLVSGLKVALTGVVPDGQTVIFAVTAPIKRRAKTAAALEMLVRGGLPAGDVRDTIEGNQIGLRRVTNVVVHMPKVIGFVHNSESDARI